MSTASLRYSPHYAPGHLVPISGIYIVVHDGHRAEHEVLAIRGEEFPSCRVCKENVRFYVGQPIPHMTHDFDLAGPRFSVRRGRAKAAESGK